MGDCLNILLYFPPSVLLAVAAVLTDDKRPTASLTLCPDNAPPTHFDNIIKSENRDISYYLCFPIKRRNIKG